MLGLVLIYWIGKAFYQLAERNGKSVWGHAILGVVLYYGGLLFAAMMIGIGIEMFSVSLGTYSDILVTLMAFPFGLLSCWIAFRYLERRWSDAVEENPEEVR